MADIGDIVVTAHSDDADDDDGMVPASGATASGATPSGATASGGASPPDAFEDPFEGVDPAALAAMEAAAVKAAAVDEDAYIANDPRAQERAREASAMFHAHQPTRLSGRPNPRFVWYWCTLTTLGRQKAAQRPQHRNARR